jgi:DNA end-binding protein Ku
MAADAMWSGAITLGAMAVPVKLYAATASEPGERLPLKVLHQGCNAPLKQVSRCEACAAEVHGEYAKVRGYEWARGRFALLGKDEVPRAEDDEKHVVAIEEFVPAEQIDPLVLHRHYWVLPDGNPRPYAILHRAMRQKSVAAITRVALKSKLRLALLFPRGQYLMLSTMFYADEIRAHELSPGADGVAVDEGHFEGMLHTIDAYSNIFLHGRYRDAAGLELRALVADRVEAAMLAAPAAAAELGADAIIEALRAPQKVR